IATRRVGAPLGGDTTPAVKYQLGDNLGSSHVVLDAAGSLVNREEYLPYGETSFGSYGKKRYRFTGKERDDESGLYYHGARYYASWLGRWSATDPAGMVDGPNLYTYVRGSPVMLRDPNGMATYADSLWTVYNNAVGGYWDLLRGIKDRAPTPAEQVLLDAYIKIQRDTFSKINRALKNENRRAKRGGVAVIGTQKSPDTSRQGRDQVRRTRPMSPKCGSIRATPPHFATAASCRA